MENQNQQSNTGLLHREQEQVDAFEQERLDTEMDNPNFGSTTQDTWSQNPVDGTDVPQDGTLAQEPGSAADVDPPILDDITDQTDYRDGGTATDVRDPHIAYSDDEVSSASIADTGGTETVAASTGTTRADHVQGEPAHSSDDEIIRVVHRPKDENDDKPWELEFENVGALKKARAILNYPIHQFETEQKALEVAEMLRDIIKADAVVEDDGTYDPRGEDENGQFFRPVS